MKNPISAFIITFMLLYSCKTEKVSTQAEKTTYGDSIKQVHQDSIRNKDEEKPLS